MLYFARSWVLLSLSIAMLFSMSVRAQESQTTGIGMIKSLTGDVTIVRTAPVQARVGDLLNATDTIEVGAGSVGLTFRDGTRVSLGPKTRFEISKFEFDPVEGKLGLFLKLISGKLQYISGRIAKLAPDSVKVETPVATVGVRGTRFVVEVR